MRIIFNVRRTPRNKYVVVVTTFESEVLYTTKKKYDTSDEAIAEAQTYVRENPLPETTK